VRVGQRRVAGCRASGPPKADDAEPAARRDELVAKTDVAWVLGEIPDGGQSNQQRAVRWISERPGVRHLIAENPASVHP
jgi:calcineurin-like phosphoesterase family protein